MPDPVAVGIAAVFGTLAAVALWRIGKRVLEWLALLLGIAAIAAAFGQDHLARALERWLVAIVATILITLAVLLGGWAYYHLRIV
jgi:hypothetical protein